MSNMRTTLRGNRIDTFITAEEAVFVKHGWAVFYERDIGRRTYRIAKVEPWDIWEHGVPTPRHKHRGLMRIEEAPDELDAYTQAMRRLEGTDK